MVYPILKLTAFPFLKLFIKELTGLENIPKKGPFIIASNHNSYLDPLIICSVVIPKINNKIHFIAIRDGAKRNFWALGDLISRKWAGCIPLDKKDRGEGALKEAMNLLKNNGIVALFPEGELTKKETEPRTGAVRLALGSKATIVPVYLEGTAEILPPLKLIPKRIKRIIRIKIGKPIDLSKNNKTRKKDLRCITEIVMKEVYNLAK